MKILTLLLTLPLVQDPAPSGPRPWALPGIGQILYGPTTSTPGAAAGGFQVFPAGGGVAPSLRLGPTFAIDNHGLGLKTTGQVVGWGSNDAGEATPPAALGLVLGLRNGQNHSYARLSNRTLVGWGSTQFGQILTPPDLGPVHAFSVGADHNLALVAGGGVRVWGCENCPFDFGSGDVPAFLDDAVQVDAEGPVCLVLRADGSLIAWGDQTPANWPFPPISCGQSNTPALQGVVRIAAGTVHGLALLDDGTVVGWGAECPSTDYGQADVPPNLPPVVDIAAGAQHSLALLEDGTVVGWGLDFLGQATPPTFLDDVVAIDARGFRSAALRQDGSIVVWGDTSFGVGTPPPGPYALPVR